MVAVSDGKALMDQLPEGIHRQLTRHFKQLRDGDADLESLAETIAEVLRRDAVVSNGRNREGQGE